MTMLARFISLLAGGCICLTVAPAAAQTINLPQTAFEIERETTRSDDERPLDISRQDCLDASDLGHEPNDGTDSSARSGSNWIVMEPQITGLDRSKQSSDSLQVWVSETADCSQTSARNTNRQCWLVYSDSGVQRNNTLIINPRDVIAADTSVTNFTASTPRPESICSETKNLIQRSLTFYILYFSQGDNVAAQATWTKTAQDLAAPPPPDDVTVGPGDEYLFFEWDIDSESEVLDTLGFVFYCVPYGTIDEDEDPADSGSGGDGSGGDGSGGNGSGGDGSGGAASGGDTAQGGMGAAAPTLTCEQNVISDGEFATASAIDYKCGEVLGRSARRGQTEKVKNNVEYAVGVAAVDNVGNSGKLKVFSKCEMPQEVTTFFEGYDEAGGKGGGGFCGYHSKGTGALWWLLALGGGALLYRRRKTA